MNRLPPCPECGATEFSLDVATADPMDDEWYCVNGHLQEWTVVRVEQ